MADAAKKAEFEQAAESVKGLKSCSQADQLILYGLYKQATVGDVNIARPGMFDPKGGAKWDAWNKNKGMSQAEAMDNYIMKAQQLLEA